MGESLTQEHRGLSMERWAQMPLVEQMANVGSEIERAIRWRAKKNEAYANKASERALELFDLTLASSKYLPRLREVARAREAWAEYFFGSNAFRSNEHEWTSYFSQFAYAARRNA